MIDPAAPQPGPSSAPHAARDRTPPTPFAEAEGPSFWDVLDVVNPLHHIPVVGSLYRELTGDAIGTGPRLAGGALFGGLIGLGAAFVNMILEGLTGRDAGEHVIALFGDRSPAPPRTAEAAPAPPPLGADGSAIPPERATRTAAAKPRFFPVPPRGSRAVPAFLPLDASVAPRAPTAAADHPLIRAAETRSADGGGDWFTGRAMDALEKYRRGARLEAAP